LVVWSALVTAVVIGPMAQRGWLLTLDWVSGPRTGWWSRVGDRASLPAGPLFFTFAAALRSSTGAFAGWLVPALALATAGWAAGRTGATTVWGRAAATTAAVWNPFVHERLYAGQVAMLAGYACLLGLVACQRRVGRGRPVRLGLWWAAATACSLQFAVLGGMVLLALGLAAPDPGSAAGVAAPTPRLDQPRAEDREPYRTGWWGRARDPLVAGGLAGALTVAWLLLSHGEPPDAGSRATVDAFATRSDTRWGLAVGTLLGRGFWRAAPGAPGSWGGWWGDVLALAVPLGAAIGWWVWWRTRRRVAVGVGVLAGAAWVLSWGTSGPLGPVYGRAVAALPAAGLFREAGKFLVVVALCAALVVGVAVDRLDEALRSPRRRAPAVLGPVALAAAVLLPVLSSPSLAWGVGGRLAAVRYPASWEQARRSLPAGAADGSVLVLPLLAYWDPGFTGGRIVANPARWYFGDVVRTGDDAGLAGVAPSADTRAVADALTAEDVDAALGRLGVDWVLVLRPGADGEVRTAALTLVFEDGGVSLWRRPGAPAAIQGRSPSRR
jgi:hypothetical protein